MEKIALPERPDWPDTAKAHGFTFADMHGEPYWDETSAYVFTMDEIEVGVMPFRGLRAAHSRVDCDRLTVYADARRLCSTPATSTGSVSRLDLVIQKPTRGYVTM